MQRRADASIRQQDVAAPYIERGGAAARWPVLREQGVNGQIEMAAALDRAGFEAARRPHDGPAGRPRDARRSSKA